MVQFSTFINVNKNLKRNKNQPLTMCKFYSSGSVVCGGADSRIDCPCPTGRTITPRIRYKNLHQRYTQL